MCSFNRAKVAILTIVLFLLASAPVFAVVTTNGVLYVSNDAPNYGDSAVLSIASDGTKSPIVGGLNYPAGLAVDGQGNVYVANYVDDSITKVTPAGVASQFAALQIPYGLTVDANNNLYVSHIGSSGPSDLNTVSKITPDGQVSTYATGFVSPSGLAFNSNDELYVANRDVGTISKVAPGGGVAATFVTGINQPNGMTFDTLGNLYVAEWGTNSVLKFSDDGTRQTYATVGFHPLGLAFDGAGDLFTANYDGGSISEIAPNGQVSTYASGFTGADFVAWSPIPEPSTTFSWILLVMLVRRSR